MLGPAYFLPQSILAIFFEEENKDFIPVGSYLYWLVPTYNPSSVYIVVILSKEGNKCWARLISFLSQYWPFSFKKKVSDGSSLFNP